MGLLETKKEFVDCEDCKIIHLICESWSLVILLHPTGHIWNMITLSCVIWTSLLWNNEQH